MTQGHVLQLWLQNKLKTTIGNCPKEAFKVKHCGLFFTSDPPLGSCWLIPQFINVLDSGHLSILVSPKPRAKLSKSFTPQIFRTKVDFYLHWYL